MHIVIKDRIDRDISAEADALVFGLQGFILVKILPDGIKIPFY